MKKIPLHMFNDKSPVREEALLEKEKIETLSSASHDLSPIAVP